jgi:hypothetical protein
MNCNAGDLAIIVSVTGQITPACRREPIEAVAIGRIVRTVRLCQPSHGSGTCWVIDRPFKVPLPGGEMKIYGVDDRDLRPIRGQVGLHESPVSEPCEVLP